MNNNPLYIKSPSMLFLAIVVLMVTGVFYLLGDLLITGDERNIFLIANLLTSIPFLFYYYSSKYIYVFNPINFVFPSILLGTTLRGIYIYIGIGNNEYVDQSLLLGKNFDVLFSGSMINLVSAWLLLFGFLFIKTKVIRIKGIPKVFTSNIWSKNRLYTLLLILVSISTVAFVIYLGRIDFSLEKLSVKRHTVIEADGEQVVASFGYLTLFIKFGEIALHLFAIWYYSTTKKFKLNLFLILIVLFLVAHIPNFVDSSRSAIIYSISFILITRLVLRAEKFEIRRLLPLVGLVIFIIIFMGSLREVYNYREEDASSKIAEDFSVVNILEKVVGNRNMMGVSKTSHIYEAWNSTDKYTYLGGSSLFSWVFAPIPRSIWPEKPQTSIGLNIKEIFGNSEAVARGGVPPTLPGELYMNFGYFGIFLITFYGMFLKWFNNLMKSYSNRNTVYLYFVILIHIAFGLIGNNVSKTMADLMMDAIPIYVMLSFIVVSYKRNYREEAYS